MQDLVALFRAYLSHLKWEIFLSFIQYAQNISERAADMNEELRA